MIVDFMTKHISRYVLGYFEIGERYVVLRPVCGVTRYIVLE